MPTTISDVVDDLVLSTMRDTSEKKFYDNVFSNRPLLERAMRSMKTMSGREIIVAMAISKNPQAKSYTPGSEFTPGKYNYADAGVAQWKHIGAPITYFPEEAAQNSGENEIIPYVKGIITNSEGSYAEAINDMLLLNFQAAGNGGADIDPLSLAIIQDPTGAVSYLGIDPSTSATSYHRNARRDFTGLSTQSAVRLRLFRLISDTTNGTGGAPSLIVSDNNAFDMFNNVLATNQRNNTDMGFPTFSAKGVDFISDQNVRSAADGAIVTDTNGTCYVINERMWTWAKLHGRERQLDDFQHPVGGTARTALLTGSMTWFLHARRKFGVGHSIDTTVSA